MKRRWLHISLALLVLAQPVASAATWSAMLSAQLDAISHGQSVEMPGCHEAMPELPDCCDGTDGVHCGMDCGTASPAVSQAIELAPPSGHGAWTPAAAYVAPSSPPTSLYKPPRTS